MTEQEIKQKRLELLDETEELKTLGIDFLDEIQYLHDNILGDFWIETGLSKAGKQKYQQMKIEFC